MTYAAYATQRIRNRRNHAANCRLWVAGVGVEYRGTMEECIAWATKWCTDKPCTVEELAGNGWLRVWSVGRA